MNKIAKNNRWVWMTIAIIFGLFFLIQFSSYFTPEEGFSAKEKVGIVTLEGPIFDVDHLIENLDQFSTRSDVKSIVLRVNSPGGAVAPSQEIYEKIKSISKHKPVVTSVGSIAASGGFYAAAGSNKIVANRGSILGSIGVIVEYPIAVELLEKVGLRFETITSGVAKDIGSPTREVTPRDREALKSVVQNLHEQFVNAVVSGRSLPKDFVLTLADGRVFTGEQSYELGLVDTLGTLDDAVRLAGQLANIIEKPERIYPEKKRHRLLDYFFNELEEKAYGFIQTMPLFLWKLEK
jgi:protease-4